VLKRSKGFTLLEIMVVVMLIGMLAVLAIPNFLISRETARMNTCLNNLRQLDFAKVQMVMEHRIGLGEAIDPDELVQYLKGLKMPVCPASGTYDIGDIDQPAACSYESDRFPHALSPDNP